ncbi:hypothetical protein KIPB_013987, partial [Kipferlia bialata]
FLSCLASLLLAVSSACPVYSNTLRLPAGTSR